MIRSAARIILVLATILGIVLPQGSALMAALGGPGDRYIVICTGDGLRTIHIDAEGNPVETSDRADHCVFSHSVDRADAVRSAPARQEFLFTVPDTPDTAQILAHTVDPATYPRAPPAV